MVKHLHFAQYISFFRLMLGPATLVYLTDWEHKDLFLLIIVVISAISDFLDGYIARARGKTSYLGAIHDLTADKIFLLSALLVFSVVGRIPVWVTFIILYREIIVMGFRIYTSYSKVEIKASILGKYKTAVLFIGLIVMLLGFDFYMIIIYISLVLTIVSFIDYLFKFRKIVLAEK